VKRNEKHQAEALAVPVQIRLYPVLDSYLFE
jgi:hypothetical protein